MSEENIYFCKVAEIQFEYPELRVGQAFYNVAYELYNNKMLCAQKDCDCFYVDANIRNLLNYLFGGYDETNNA